MKNFKGKISVIMPIYNESNDICENILETKECFEDYQCSYEIIAVNDGSTDTTLKNLKKHFDNDPFLRIVTYKENQGKGFALRKGFSYCSGDLIAFLDADLDLHPNQLDGLYRKMVKEGADVVIGSKFHPQSKLIYPIHRKMISIIYCLILYLLFRLPLKDTQTGLKLFKKEVLDRVFPRILCKRFAFDVELLANAYRLHYKIKEVPVVLNFRRNRKWGRMRLKDMWYAGLDTLAIFYRMYILKYYEKGRNIMNIP